MSRLYDRVMNAGGCEPLSLRHVIEWLGGADEAIGGVYAEPYRAAVREALEEASDREPTDEEVSAAIRTSLSQMAGKSSSDYFEFDELESAIVLSAEEVADYWATFPEGTNMLDVLDCLAPPFERFFVEFQHRPNVLDLESWGLLFGGLRHSFEKDGDEGWVLGASLIGEWRKARPVGPIVRWVVPLDEDGLPDRADKYGLGSIFAFPLEVPGMPQEEAYRFANSLNPLLGPGLFAISLLHCKNVDIRQVDPPERLSRKAQRKHGRPLTRYYVLDIEPMRRVLDREGEAHTKGLSHALHICRGHFKVFTNEAPLFGKHAGTYWWEAQARGGAESGVIDKDYRVRLDLGLGREYVDANEHPEIKPSAPEHSGLDADLGGRGLRAHNRTQNLLASAVRAAGYEPRRPKPEEPQYDLAWEAGHDTWVAEVKSITAQNEERQLRLAVGQVVRYRQLLAAEGWSARAMIAVEREPSDTTWADLCGEEEITLVWPGNIHLR